MSKEQIEEMAKDLGECHTIDEWAAREYGEAYTDFHASAEKMLDRGWIKQSEGEWEFEFTLDGDDFYKCSVCGRQEVINGLCKERNPVEHCPYCHCGARMSGGKNE